MRRLVPFILLALVPLAALTHCWWRGGAVPRPGHSFWCWRVMTPGRDNVTDLCWHDDALYVAGFTRPLFSEDSRDCFDGFLTKADRRASEQWFEEVHTPGQDFAHGVAAAPSGVYVVGDTSRAFAGQENADAGYWDGFLARYTTEGGRLWVRQVAGPLDDAVGAVAADTSGIYVLGYWGDDFRADDALRQPAGFVRCYNSEGRVAWTRWFGPGGRDHARALATDPTGVYVVGSILAPGPPVTATAVCAVIRKYDRHGRELWTQRLGGASCSAAAVCYDRGAVYVVARGGSLWGPRGTTVILARYDPDGTRRWVRALRNPVGITVGAVRVDGDDVYVVGSISGGIEVPYPRVRNRDFSDVFVARYTSSGQRCWLRRFGTRDDDEATSVAVGTEYIYVGGNMPDARRPYDPACWDAFVARLRREKPK